MEEVLPQTLKQFQEILIDTHTQGYCFCDLLKGMCFLPGGWNRKLTRPDVGGKKYPLWKPVTAVDIFCINSIHALTEQTGIKEFVWKLL